MVRLERSDGQETVNNRTWLPRGGGEGGGCGGCRWAGTWDQNNKSGRGQVREGGVTKGRQFRTRKKEENSVVLSSTLIYKVRDQIEA